MKLRIIVMLVFYAVFSTNAQIPTNGLVGYWPLDGDALDYSGYLNNGIIVGAVSDSDRFSIPNTSYYFDGSDKITILDSPSLNPDSQITICVWYRGQQFTGLGYSAILDKGYTSHSAPYYQYKFGASAGFNNEYSFGFSLSLNGVENRLVTPLQYWTVDEWYFLVGVYDGYVQRFYVNNSLIASDSVIGPLDNYNSPFYIGDNTTASDKIEGNVDDVRIYNRALTPDEIENLFHDGLCKTLISVTDTLVINWTINSVNPLTYENTIKVYPNITSDHITIENTNVNLLAGYNLKIVNSAGQIVFNSVVNTPSFYLDLSTWTGQGMYFVYLTDANNNLIDVKKIVLN